MCGDQGDGGGRLKNGRLWGKRATADVCPKLKTFQRMYSRDHVPSNISRDIGFGQPPIA